MSLASMESGTAAFNGGGGRRLFIVESSPPSSSSRLRKPVPTPRNTLNKKKPPSSSQATSDLDSQGQSSSIDSPSTSLTSSSESASKAASSEESPPTSNDILAALEKIPGVGSLRLTHKVKRDVSNNSLLSSISGGQITEDIELDLIKSNSPTKSKVNSPSKSVKSLTISERNQSPVGNPLSPLKKPQRRGVNGRNDDDGTPIQTRPLPKLPPLSHKKTDTGSAPRSPSDNDDERIYSSLLTPSENPYSELTNTPTGKISENSHYLTMTGTVKRGRKKKAQDVDIHLDISAADHLTLIEERVNRKYHDRCFCGLRRGIHILILSLLSLPIMWILSTFQAFFLGTMTWYNIFIHYNEERTCCHKLLSPIILLIYPFWICPVTILLGIFGGLVQISWYLDSWLQEIRNPDSGFFAWFCNKVVDLPDCAPYQIVYLPPLDSNHVTAKCGGGGGRELPPPTPI